jgi:hypothetical protein
VTDGFANRLFLANLHKNTDTFNVAGVWPTDVSWPIHYFTFMETGQPFFSVLEVCGNISTVIMFVGTCPLKENKKKSRKYKIIQSSLPV